MRRFARSALAGALVLACAAAVGPPSAASTADPDPVGLRHAAAVNDMSVARLRTILSDPTAHLDREGRLLFKDAVPATRHQDRIGRAAPFPLADTFSLHSNPGSARTIFLDFDGATVSGTQWNLEGVPSGSQPAWDTDGDPGSFGTAERTAIQNIWLQVSEDYAAFDVDVTTEDQGDGVIDRTGPTDQQYGAHALITPSTSAEGAICGSPPNGGCGGVAYTDVFDEAVGHQQHQPAWIFPHELADDAKYIAEAVSHEVGHQLSLSHDGYGDDPDYYPGHAPWAPIMGAGYDQPIVQWSKGDYAGATNHEDDLARITQSGLSYRTDEAGGSIGTASALPAGTAYITTRGDLDFYSLGECDGELTVDAEPAPVSPDLDIELKLYRSDGTLIDSDNPPSARVDDFVATGMAASIDADVTPGSYVVSVDGVGNGSAVSGYDDYASIGAYTLTSSCDSVGPDPDPDPVAPGAPRIGKASSGARGGQSTATARWRAPLDDGGADIDGYRVYATRWKHGRAARTLSSQVLGARTTVATFRLKRGTWSFRVEARNSVGFGDLSPASRRVKAR